MAGVSTAGEAGVSTAVGVSTGEVACVGVGVFLGGDFLTIFFAGFLAIFLGAAFFGAGFFFMAGRFALEAFAATFFLGACFLDFMELFFLDTFDVGFFFAMEADPVKNERNICGDRAVPLSQFGRSTSLDSTPGGSMLREGVASKT